MGVFRFVFKGDVMSFKHLLPLLLLVPAISFADSDRNFKIAPNMFKEGVTLESKTEIALEKKGLKLSEAPKVPLRSNAFYYRQKKGPKDYNWYVGQPDLKNYEKLHAFSLKENYLKSAEVVTMRFYSNQNNKAFQDENDIYFDKEYIYSSRVPKLFFMKNGRWQTLKETDLPGIISMDSSVEGLQAVAVNPSMRSVASTVYPLAPGMYAFVFSAPGYLPYVDAVSVQEGQVIKFKPQLPKADTTGANKDAKFSVTEASVAQAKTLEDVEALYDTFVRELDGNVSLVDTNEFTKIYPVVQTSLKLGVAKDDDIYKEYVSRFENTRRNAKDQWRSDKLGNAGAVSRAIHAKKDSLEALPLRGVMAPARVEPVYDEQSKDRPIVAVRIFFGQEKSRYDFAWVGTVNGLSAADFYGKLTAGENVKFALVLANNKPVWIYNKGVLLGRFQYRYEKLEVFVDNKSVACQGKFELPAHIRDQEEVQAWLNRPKEEVKEQSVKDVDEKQSAADSLAAALERANDIGSVDLRTNVRIVRDREHGTVALLDSGMFRYYGRVVSMSPFAIQTTEVTQQFFRDVMDRVEKEKKIVDKSSFQDPNKPVHNINWDDARAFCQLIGGDLPTEAQWEFAGRADNNEGSLWNLDEDPDPTKYAIFRDNSYKLGKKNPGYGPQQVALRKPNAWNIYDMSGNVAEWTRDSYFMFSFWVESSNPTGAMMGLHKVYKGGSWKDSESRLNLTEADDEDPRYWSDAIGFRCAFPISVFDGEATAKKEEDAQK